MTARRYHPDILPLVRRKLIRERRAWLRVPGNRFLDDAVHATKPVQKSEVIALDRVSLPWLNLLKRDDQFDAISYHTHSTSRKAKPC